ncbi:MAG: peroxiredoxin [Candidatus Puniceispirillum sp.]|nr:peroxiredoxin [Candidatus Puniceispirillum sp.]MBL6774586.1 peroxiredoxin [Candidatus Puniceispirillum sp.]
MHPSDNSAKTPEMAYKSLIGTPAIDFAARSTMGEVRLSALVGRWILLFCHPADFTPVCTSEFVALAREQDKFAEMDVQLLGLSVDSVYSHMGWVEWIETEFDLNVKFPVIEDVSMDIARAYGMIDSYSDTTSTVRACMFIDPAQKIQALIHYPMHIGRSVDELLRVQRALIETYQAKKAAPANWTPGDAFLQSAADALSGGTKGWLKRAMRSFK